MNVLTEIEKLNNYVLRNNFNGYDPYDTLNSFLPFRRLGHKIAVLAIQFQKRNPFNIRPLLGIKKGKNPKAMGLFLKAYVLLYKSTGEQKYLDTATKLFEWLTINYSKGYSGICWGYNFDWANPDGYLPSYTPSVVVTSFVVDGLYNYFLVTKNPKAKELIDSAAIYIIKDIPITKFKEGISFSYTHKSKGSCYNASLLAAEVLAKSDIINGANKYSELIEQAVTYVLSKQKELGEWWYSFNPETHKERNQIDFHQGFVLVSLRNLNRLCCFKNLNLEDAIQKGLDFYKKKQFLNNGQPMWRLPKRWPVDIHNISQGIITFSLLSNKREVYHSFAKNIAEWAINNMQSSKGYFFYRKYSIGTNKISFMRWGQAWMLLALTELYIASKK